MPNYTKHRMTVLQAMDTLKTNMKEDPEFAWSWHCNIAVQFQDAGVSHAISNDGASRFMKLCFGVDTLQRRGVPPTKIKAKVANKPDLRAREKTDNPPISNAEKED